ncbi:MAG TPA: hypothetical protein VN040_17120 [Pseudosphingobacterium sp.]|nr:hypothetical protein [Pseudosphingobacterium sp.]
MLLIFGCNPEPEGKLQVNEKPYFDIAGYFSKEAERLQTKESLIKKVVSKNDEQEERQIQLESWKNEFELFISSDINKPDWLTSYAIDSSTQKTSYLTKDPKLRTKGIQIYRDIKGHIKKIAIENSDKNWLYHSSEKLIYYTDSLYRIEKIQSIRLIGTNKYSVEGIIKK